MLDIPSGKKVTLLSCSTAALRVSSSILGNFGVPSQSSLLLRNPLPPLLLPLLCSSNNVFQMTRCPTLSFVCSVVRGTLVKQFLHMQHGSQCAGPAERMWTWMKYFIICLIERSLVEACSSVVMISRHASLGPVAASFFNV